MKIKKLTKYKNKLIELKLINTEIFNKKNLLEKTNIGDIKYQLKKSLQVIYKYNINNKKILFVGGTKKSSRIFSTELKSTKHKWIPELNWVNGILTNRAANSKTVTLKKPVVQFQKKYDLILVFNYNSNTSTIEEGYSTKIPIISLNIKPNILNNKCSYKIPGNFKFTEKFIRNTFFFSVLKATLKKASLLKKIKTYQKYNESDLKKKTFRQISNKTKRKYK